MLTVVVVLEAELLNLAAVAGPILPSPAAFDRPAAAGLASIVVLAAIIFGGVGVGGWRSLHSLLPASAASSALLHIPIHA